MLIHWSLKFQFHNFIVINNSENWNWTIRDFNYSPFKGFQLSRYSVVVQNPVVCCTYNFIFFTLFYFMVLIVAFSWIPFVSRYFFLHIRLSLFHYYSVWLLPLFNVLKPFFLPKMRKRFFFNKFSRMWSVLNLYFHCPMNEKKRKITNN